MEAWREELYDTYLSHHGIEGQKWGKRNGPPYPLDYNDHSAAEKRFFSRPKNVISGVGKIKRQGDGIGTGPLGNRGMSGGGGLSSESDKELIDYLSKITGMKKEEISKLLALYEKKGVNNPTFLRLLSELSEGDSNQSKKILDAIKEHYSSKTTKSNSSIEENVSSWLSDIGDKLLSDIKNIFFKPKKTGHTASGEEFVKLKNIMISDLSKQLKVHDENSLNLAYYEFMYNEDHKRGTGAKDNVWLDYVSYGDPNTKKQIGTVFRTFYKKTNNR